MDSLQNLPIYHYLLERAEVVYYFYADTVEPPISNRPNFQALVVAYVGFFFVFYFFPFTGTVQEHTYGIV